MSARKSKENMPPKPLASSLLPYLGLASLLIVCFYSTFLTFPLQPLRQLSGPPSLSSLSFSSCDLFRGKWVYNPSRPKPSYDETCPFHRNAWNCIKNGKPDMGKVNSWEWVPKGCDLERFDARGFLGSMRDRNVGFVGDSLSENMVVALLCALRSGDESGRKWKKKGAWRGGYFPEFNVTVGYHRAVLLTKYRWQSKDTVGAGDHKSDGFYQVNVDLPADDWANISEFYDVLIFNTGHWWGPDKFPLETPLVFYRGGKPIHPALDMMDGLEVVLKSMVSYIERNIPKQTLKFWRLQSPGHFYGGKWNQNGSCLFEEPLKESQLDAWFGPSYDGVNKEARRLNGLITRVLHGTDIQVLDFTHLSEFRADAHPAIWLGKKDAVAIWGQDCLHWCLPGVPDTWLDILAQLIRQSMRRPIG